MSPTESAPLRPGLFGRLMHWHRTKRTDPSDQRSGPELELLHRLRQPGCPICSDAEECESSHLFWLWHESYLEPEVRARFQEALGFCVEHGADVTRLVDYGDSVAHLHQAIVHHAREHLTHSDASTLHALASRGQCPVCASRADTAARSAFFLAKLLDGGDARYGEPALLCFPHLQLLAPRLRLPGLPRWLELHLERLCSARAALLRRDVGVTAAATVQGALEAVVGHDAQRSARLAFGMADIAHHARDPLRDLAASLSRTDACPVCRVVARTWRETLTWLQTAAERGDDVIDVLPTCPQHAPSCAAFGGPALAIATARAALEPAISQIFFARREAEARPRAPYWRERLRQALETEARRLEQARQICCGRCTARCARGSQPVPSARCNCCWHCSTCLGTGAATSQVTACACGTSAMPCGSRRRRNPARC